MKIVRNWWFLIPFKMKNTYLRGLKTLITVDFIVRINLWKFWTNPLRSFCSTSHTRSAIFSYFYILEKSEIYSLLKKNSLFRVLASRGNSNLSKLTYLTTSSLIYDNILRIFQGIIFFTKLIIFFTNMTLYLI